MFGEEHALWFINLSLSDKEKSLITLIPLVNGSEPIFSSSPTLWKNKPERLYLTSFFNKLCEQGNMDPSGVPYSDHLL